MIVVDTSVWVDYFNGVDSRQTDLLDELLGRDELLVGDLILVEVLQGFRRDSDFRRARRLLSAFEQVTMIDPTLALRAARNFRLLRRRGATVRKTIDTVIGTYCIEQRHSLLHSDRDFEPMHRWLGLRSALVG